MRVISGVFLIATTALLASAPARADLLLAFSDAEYDALNAAASPFDQIGGAFIHWGNPTVLGTATTPNNYEYGITSLNDNTLLTKGDQAWSKISNTIQPTTASTPLWTYTAAGKLTMSYKGNALGPVSTSATIGKGANAFWIRAQMPPKGAYASIALAGMILTFTSDHSTYVLDSLTGDIDADYIGFSDPRLALGFTIKWGFGYIGNFGGDAVWNNPGFELSIGSYVTPPANPYLVAVDPGVLPDPGALGGAALMGLSGPGLSDISAVPEPASWALMIGGFGLVGTSLRRRRSVVA